MAKVAVATSRTYPSSVGAPHEHRQAIIALLNTRLADSFDLHSQGLARSQQLLLPHHFIERSRPHAFGQWL